MSAARDGCHRRSRTSHDDGVRKPQGIALEVAVVPSTRQEEDRVADALRLLATWAVRAARGHTVGQNQDLTVRPPEAMNAARTSEMEKTPCQ